MTFRERTVFAFLAAAALTTVLLHSRSFAADGAEVAVLLDLTGSQASLGGAAMNGFLLALRRTAPAAGPIAYTAVLDTRSDSAVARSTAREVAARISVAAGFTDNDAVLAAGPVFQDAGVPFLSIGATDPSLAKAIGDNVFLTPFGDNAQAAAAAEFGQRRFGDTVAILWDNTSNYTRSLPRYFRTRFEKIEGAILFDRAFNGGCDLSAQGAELAALTPPPAFIYLAGLPDCIGETVLSLRAAGVTQPIVGGDGFDTPNLRSAGGPGRQIDDVWYTTHAWLSSSKRSDAARAFVEKYEAAYGAPPSDSFAALGYDAGNLLLDVLQRADSHEPDAVAHALETTTDFKGVTGSITFTKDDHVPEKTVWVVRVSNGEAELADAFVPAGVPAPLDPAP